jgi:signal transduction histidine kinase
MRWRRPGRAAVEVGTALPRTAWLLCTVTLSALGGQAALLLTAGIPLLSVEALAQAFPLVPLGIAVGAVVGAAIVRRHPRHRVGWLLCIGQAGAAVGLLGQTLGAAVLRHGLGLPSAVAQRALWIGHLLGASYGLALLGLLLLVVPDGRLPSRRWWPVAALLSGGLTLTALGLLLVSPESLTTDGVRDVGILPTVMEVVGQLCIAVGLVAAAAALVGRLRRSSGVQRQQLRWISAAAGALAVTLAALVGDNIARGGSVEGRWYLESLFYLAYLSVPVATGMAVLRHRLYDIDAILGRTAWLLVLAVFVTAGYVAAVVAIGTVVGTSTGAVLPSLAAYVVVALAFQPVRRRVDRIADRVAYGPRAGPYESLAALSRTLGARGLSDQEVLSLLARSAAVALGARSASATVVVPGGAGLTACWPEDRPEGSIERTGVRVPVDRNGRSVGCLELALRPGHRLTRVQRRLLAGFAAQAGPPFETIGLMAALRDRADGLARQGAELAASRRRLVQAADLERARVAAAIRSSVSVHLEPFPAALTALTAGVGDGPVDAQEVLRGLQRSTSVALESLRGITAGILPPLLLRHGLAIALREHAARSPGRIRVAADPVEGRRFDPSVEAAAYLAAVTALDGIGTGAEAELDLSGEQLRVLVRGRRVPGPADRQPLLDRVQAVGGDLVERTVPGGVTELCAQIPVAVGGRAGGAGR